MKANMQRTTISSNLRLSSLKDRLRARDVESMNKLLPCAYGYQSSDILSKNRPDDYSRNGDFGPEEPRARLNQSTIAYNNHLIRKPLADKATLSMERLPYLKDKQTMDLRSSLMSKDDRQEMVNNYFSTKKSLDSVRHSMSSVKLPK